MSETKSMTKREFAAALIADACHPNPLTGVVNPAARNRLLLTAAAVLKAN